MLFGVFSSYNLRLNLLEKLQELMILCFRRISPTNQMKPNYEGRDRYEKNCPFFVTSYFITEYI